MSISFDIVEAERLLRAAEPKLKPLMERHGPFRPWRTVDRSPFAALAEAIAYQQLTGKAASTIFSRVLALYRPKRFPSPEDILATRDEDLRSAGLSRAKVAAVKDLSLKTIDGTVPTLAAIRKLDDEEIVERLTAVRGVGRWTVEMLLIRLGRPDVLPAHDYGVRKGFKAAFGTRGLPTPAQVLRRGERWRPYRTVASWYLWRAIDAPPARSAESAAGA